MVITKEIFIKINPNNYNYYINLGYDAKVGKSLLVKVGDLKDGSSAKIDLMCDVCSLIFKTDNKTFKRSNGVLPINCVEILCKKCKTKKTNINKYGFENPNKSDIIKKKKAKTCFAKWGVDCPLKSDTIINKIRETNIEKYGNIIPSMNLEIQNKIKESNIQKRKINGDEILNKTKRTNLKKYGTDHHSKNEQIKEKTKNTNLKKYGVDNPFKSDEIRQKIKNTNLDKYGVDHPSKCNMIKDIKRNTFQKKYGVNSYTQTDTFKNTKRDKDIYNANEVFSKYNCEIIDYENSLYTVKKKDCGHTFKITSSLFYQRRMKSVEFCTECIPINSNDSFIENELFDFIKSLNIKSNIIKNDRSVLNGTEIDVYLQELKLGFELNGLYWHSELFKDKMYHYNKYKNAKDKNIKLIFIWEDDWLLKKDIVKSIILNKIGLIENKIYARKCKISLVDNKCAKIFYENNHIQGYVHSKYNIGLYYNNELVSLMSFSERRINGKKEFELTRFSNVLNTSVIGSASKLFRYFKDNYNYIKIYSYSDNCIFNGGIYETLSFKKVESKGINYWWVVGGKRLHRFNFNKKRLIKMGHDPNKTETQIMNEIGYYRIFGCGHTKWEIDI